MSFQLLSLTHPKARKEKPCIWCGEKIHVGESHVHYSGVQDGDFQSTRIHSECYLAMQKDFLESGEDDFPPYSFKRGTTEEK